MARRHLSRTAAEEGLVRASLLLPVRRGVLARPAAGVAGNTDEEELPMPPAAFNGLTVTTPVIARDGVSMPAPTPTDVNSTSVAAETATAGDIGDSWGKSFMAWLSDGLPVGSTDACRGEGR